uniref:S1 motif domain-containing protein n=1 Tax=viral metagenome TaxID=1070528 RepID=A0A6C0JVM2_9ZZZZ
MEYVAVFEEQVTLTPKDLRKEITSIDSILEQKLRKNLEGRCSRNGYVLPDGVHILSRSMGVIERGRFTGNLLFHVQAEGKVLNPPDGTILEGEVIRKNKMGLYVEYAKAIRIIIPRDINIGNEEFENVEVGEMVQVEIKKSRFQVNDEYILSVGLFKGRSRGERANVYDTNQNVSESDNDDEGEDEGNAGAGAEDGEGDDGAADRVAAPTGEEEEAVAEEGVEAEDAEEEA